MFDWDLNTPLQTFIKTTKNHYFKENKKVFLSENINIKMIFTQKAKNCLKFKLYFASIRTKYW